MPKNGALPAATAKPLANYTSTPIFSEKQPQNYSADGNYERFSLEILRNAEYHSASFSEPFQLVDGIFYIPPIVPVESQDNWYIQLNDLVTFGDINTDSFEDAVVILTSRRGGVGALIELAAVVNQNGVPYNLATVSLGDRVIVKSISIQNSEIRLDMIVHKSTDGLCCPSLETNLKFKLSGTVLEKLPSPSDISVSTLPLSIVNPIWLKQC
jgi:hypothetical protein